ncbi:MAG: MFS transporter [Sphingomonadales bacterium 32-68-7]|nr:MAG: MFS transporter [Sphingomonadales bacterium 12-68-11]OYX09614.1 MAG: MFS transporter [Sphingomonadales bacterium 32-68-7]
MQPSTSAAHGNWMNNSAGYQMLLVFLLSLNFGIVFFDRQALNVLMPQVQPELGLSQTQIGIIAGGLSFTWAIAAFFYGRLSDSLSKRKILLIMATIAFSLCSFLTGLATTFALLLGARLLMGAAEGGVMPISHAMVASEVDPKRRGLAQGVAQNLGSNLLGSFAAPVVLVAFAEAFGWREAFYLAGVPGIISAVIMWFLLKEPAPLPKPAGHEEQSMTIGQALKVRNMWVCVVVGVLMVAHFVTTWAFMPLYLVQTKGYDEITASWIMGSLGIAAALYAFLISGVSDYIGRKPVMVVLPFLSVVGPLAAMYFDGPATTLAAIFFVGWAVNGIFPIFMATIPSESFRPLHHATVLGLAMGACEILGGVFGPPIAGWLNDTFGVNSFLWMLLALALASGIAAMFLRETAPAALARRGLEAQVA